MQKIEKKNVNRAKRELKDINYIQDNIDSLGRQIIEMRASIEGGAINYVDKIQSSSSGKENLICKYIDTKSKLENLKADKMEKLALYNKRIDCIPNELYQNILRMKYIEGMTLLQISLKLNIKQRTIERYHGKALIEYENLIEN